MGARITRLAALAALQLVALTLAHDLTFLARHGSRFGEALAHAGHGASWSAAVATSLLLASALMVLAAARLAQLQLQLRRRERLEPVTTAGFGGSTARSLRSVGRARPLAATWLRLGLPMAALTVGLLTLQENLERASVGAAMPGPALLLSPEYAGGLWIAIAVGLLVGLVAALFRWRLGVLLARLRAVHRRTGRSAVPGPSRPGIRRLAPRGSLLGRRSALRAPPAAVAP